MAGAVDAYLSEAIRPRLAALGFKRARRAFVRRSPSRELAIAVVFEASRWNVASIYGVPARFTFHVYLFAGREVPDTHEELLRAGAQHVNQSPVAMAIYASGDAAPNQYEVRDPRSIADLDSVLAPLLPLDTLGEALRWIDGGTARRRDFMVAMVFAATDRTDEARVLFRQELAAASKHEGNAREVASQAIVATAKRFGIDL